MYRLLFLLCSLYSLAAAGQAELDGLPRTRSFTGRDYGAENQNWDLTQSPAGILYVANSGGVLAFDGLSWTVYQLPGRPTVRAVRWSGGRLYVGGYGEFGYFPAEDGGLGPYVSVSDRLPAGERGEEIWHIEALADGRVVFQSFSGLYFLAPEGELRIEHPGSLLFAHAVGDTLLVPVTGVGLLRETAAAPATLLPGSDPGGRAIVGITGPASAPLLATENGVYRYRDGALEAWSDAANARLAGQQINRLLLLADGQVAVGTITSGVYVFSADGSERYHLSFGDGLSNNTVLALFEDRDGNLWAGLDRGIDLIVRSEPLRYFRPGERPIGAVYAAATYRGRLYVGTNQGLFVRPPGEPGFTLVPGTAGQVWELRPTPFGLLCGHNAGTFLIENGEARLLTDRSGGWQTIPFPPDTTKLLQANYTGLSILDPGAADAGAEVRLEGLLAPLRFLARTGDRELLALHGSRGGYRVGMSADWRRIERVDTITAPDLIRPLLTRFGDTLLVQTQEGSYRYRNGRFETLTTFRGIAVAPDTYFLPGRVGTQEWFLVGPERVTAYRGSRALGAYPLALRHNFPDILPLGEERYLFCLEDGFAVYHPDGEESTSGGLPLGLRIVTDSLRHRPAAGSLRIAYRHNDPRFEYALPALDRPVRYRYRLLGFGERWSEWSDSGEKEYTNLEEGDYRFQVQADWYGAQTELAFTVLPPWYRTPLAYVAYALLVAGLLFLLYREHRTRLRAQARRLEALRQRQLQRQRIEARNEQLEADIKRKSRELANSTLTLAKKNEMLLDLKEELSRLSERGAPPQESRKLLHLIDRNLNNEEDWAIFESHFNEVHEAFLKRIRKTHPQLTAGDLQLAAFLRMDLSSKEIAPLMHISVRGVENKRYRLRKKIGLEGSDNLNQYLQEF